MLKTLKVFSITFACVFVCFMGLRFGYDYIIEKRGDDVPEIGANIGEIARPPAPTEAERAARLKAGAKIIYEYISQLDGSIEKSEETAPYFLIGKTLEDIKTLYKDWQTLTFTEDLIVLRKAANLPGAQKYILGVLDGQITVFYKNPVNGSNIKEITSAPVAALPREEQQKLLDGVEIETEDELMRMLEDYGS
jgi:hypothetical protein